MTDTILAVEKLLSAYHYKIELHAHSAPASSCSEFPPRELLTRLKNEHYDAVVLTNHFNGDGSYFAADDPVGAYLADFYEAQKIGKELGITVLLGAEYRFKENNNDYLVYGIDEAFLRATVSELSLTAKEFYHKHKNEDILFLQAHPFRKGMTLADPADVDGIETYNMHPGHNSRITMAARYATGHDFPVVTVGTDLHHPGHEGAAALRAKILPTTEKELVALLRSRDYIFEIGGHPLLPYTTFNHHT